MGKFNAIGLIVPDLQNPFYANLAETLETEIARRGYDLVLESSRADVLREADHLRSITNRQVDGMVCILIDHERNYATLQEYYLRGKAVVAMHERGVGGVPVDAVTVDFHVGTTQAVQYLVGLGHRTIAFLLAVCPGQQEGDRPEVFRKLVQECGFDPGRRLLCAMRPYHCQRAGGDESAPAATQGGAAHGHPRPQRSGGDWRDPGGARPRADRAGRPVGRGG